MLLSYVLLTLSATEARIKEIPVFVKNRTHDVTTTSVPPGFCPRSGPSSNPRFGANTSGSDYTTHRIWKDTKPSTKPMPIDGEHFHTWRVSHHVSWVNLSLCSPCTTLIGRCRNVDCARIPRRSNGCLETRCDSCPSPVACRNRAHRKWPQVVYPMHPRETKSFQALYLSTILPFLPLILYKNLDLTQDFPNKISFHFLWVKMLPKNLPKISRCPEMCPLGKILAQDFQMAAFTKILERRDKSVVLLLSTENCISKRTQHVWR